MKTAEVATIQVNYKVLDGGPVICGTCISAWRMMPRCPNCGCALTGEAATPRARDLYGLQRLDEAPAVGSPEWIPFLVHKRFL